MRAGGRGAVVGALAALLFVPAAPGTLGHSPLVALPSVLPPVPLHAMSWSRESPTAAPATTYAGGRAVIGVAGGVDGRALATRLGLRTVEWLPGLRLVEVAGPPRTLARLAGEADGRIRYVEPLTRAAPAHVRNDPLTYEIDPATGAPWEWQFHSIGADQALDLTHGDPSILVGVVDSGVAAVPDLTGKIAETFWDPAVNKSAGDTIGHGTFVSSILAARDDDGFGLAGFCGACRLAVYKAAPLTDVQVAEGIKTLTDAHVRIINLSIVLDSPAQDVIDALHYATAAGVLVVAAAGNDGGTAIDFPASYVQAPGGAAGSGLAVGASDAKGVRASFSNTGQQLSLLAPGTFNTSCTVGILGAIPAIATDFEESGSCAVTMTRSGGARYAYASGTSFAVPEVAGTAALLWALKPSLTSVQVATALEQSATRPAGTSWSPSSGWGVLDAKAAVESVAGHPAVDSIALANLRVSRPRRPGSRVTVTVKAGWGDGGPIDVGGIPSCRIDVLGAAVRATSSLEGGVATCSFTLPAASAGAEVSGTVNVAAPGAQTASASFRFTAAKG
jgi:subtilisin family serine protease